MGLFGGGSSSTPPPPKVYPVDLLSTELAGINADNYGYNLSDADFAQRFPGLVQERNADISQAYKELTGPLDPTVENSFTTQGLAQAFGAFGTGSETPSIEGTAKNTVATSVANQTQSYQDNARSYIENLMASNPERAFGLNGGDLLNLAILNQGNLAQANQEAAGYASQVGAANSASSAATRNAAIGAGASILGSVIAAVH